MNKQSSIHLHLENVLNRFEISLEKRLIVVLNNDVVIVSVQHVLERLSSIRGKYVKMVNTAFSQFKTKSEVMVFLEKLAQRMVAIKV